MTAAAPACALADGSAAGADPVRPVGATGPLGSERLSNERTLTRWAYVYGRGGVRRQPVASLKPFARLRFHTEDGPLEVYLVLRSQVDVNGQVWLQIRVPGRPNGRKGWVIREALGPLHVARTYLRVNKKALRATLYRNGRRIWTSRIGIGKPSTPTPSGDFYIRERLKALGGLYGPWAFGTSDYSTLSEWPNGGVVGIHGTDQPWLIPGRPSHGCIRVPNPNIIRLARLMPVGTPVRIA